MEGYRPGQFHFLAIITCRDGERFARVYIDRGKIDEKTFAQAPTRNIAYPGIDVLRAY
jgi:hypothetical protein